MTNSITKGIRYLQNSNLTETTLQIEATLLESPKNKLGFDVRLNPVDHLYALYCELNIDERRKVRDAIHRLVIEWRLIDKNSSEYLCRLAILSADFGVSSVATRLNIIITEEILRGLPEVTYIDTVATLIATLDVFLPETLDNFRALFYSDTLEPYFCAQLFIGICKCQPANYYKYVPKFIYTLDHYPSFFHKYAILREFLSYVPLEKVVDKLVKMDFDVVNRFMIALCGGKNAPAKLISDSKNFWIVPQYNTQNVKSDVLLPSFEMTNTQLYGSFFSLIEQDLYYLPPILEDFRRGAFEDDSDEYDYFDLEQYIGDF